MAAQDARHDSGDPAGDGPGAGAGARGGEAVRAPRPKRFRVLRAAGITALVLALVVGVGGFLLLRQLDGNITSDDISGQLTDRPERSFEGPDGPLNVLVLGSDSREGVGNDIDGESGTGARADTTILLHVSADRQDVYGVSLPRDAVVDRPDCLAEDGETIPGASDVLFNTAYAVGGAACAVNTVEQLTEVFVDHYVVVDFEGFGDMVEAVDGVEVCIPVDVEDPDTGITLEAGTRTLDRDEALDYVRERQVLSANSDIGRMKRQQSFIASLVNEASSGGMLARPDRLYGFLDAATRSLTTDPGLASTRELVGLGLQLEETGLQNVQFTTVPIAEYPPDDNLLVWTEDAEGLWQLIIDDEPLSPEYADGSISALEPVPGDGGSGSGGGGDGGGDGGGGGGDGGDAAEEPSPEEFGLCG